MTILPNPATPPEAPVPPGLTPPPTVAKNNLATVALVSGIASAVTLAFNWIPYVSAVSCISPFIAILAVITGIIGLGNAKKNNGLGRGFALWGLVLGVLMLLVLVAMLIIGFAIGVRQGLGNY